MQLRSVFRPSIIPQDDLAFFSGLAEINQTLVGRAAEAQPNVLFCKDKSAVHQYVNKGKHFISVLAARAGVAKQLLQRISAVAPDRFGRVCGLQPPQKRQQEQTNKLRPTHSLRNGSVLQYLRLEKCTQRQLSGGKHEYLHNAKKEIANMQKKYSLPSCADKLYRL